jgi:alcohol dehydrogenase class IV
LGVEREKLPELAASAEKQWTGNFNPRPVNRENLQGIYQQAF